MFNIDNAVPETPYVAKPSPILKPGIVKVRPIDYRLHASNTGKHQLFIIFEAEPVEGLTITMPHKGVINPGGVTTGPFAEAQVGIYMDLALQENQIAVANFMHSMSAMTNTLEQTKGVGGSDINEFLTNILNITAKGEFGYCVLQGREYKLVTNDAGKTFPKISLKLGGFKNAMFTVPEKDVISLVQKPTLHTLEYKKDAETKTLTWDKSNTYDYEVYAEEVPTSDVPMEDVPEEELKF